MAVLEDNVLTLNEWLTGVRNDIVRNAKQQGRTATGKTERNTISEVVEQGAGLKGLIKGPPSVQFGWEDGRAPGKLPPIQPLRMWIQAKGLNMSAWALAKSIAKRGTKLYREGGNSGVVTDVITQERIAQLSSRVAANWTKAYVNQVFENLPNPRSGGAS